MTQFYTVELTLQQEQWLLKGLEFISYSFDKALAEGKRLGFDCKEVANEKAEIDQLIEFSQQRLSGTGTRRAENIELDTLERIRGGLDIAARLIELEARDPASQTLPRVLRSQFSEAIEQIGHFGDTMLFPSVGRSGADYSREWLPVS